FPESIGFLRWMSQAGHFNGPLLNDGRNNPQGGAMGKPLSHRPSILVRNRLWKTNDEVIDIADIRRKPFRSDELRMWSLLSLTAFPQSHGEGCVRSPSGDAAIATMAAKSKSCWKVKGYPRARP